MRRPCLCGLLAPVVRQQGIQFRFRSSPDSDEDVLQPFSEGNLVRLTGFRKGIKDCERITAFFASREERILANDRKASDHTFGGIVIHGELGVREKHSEFRFDIQGVAYSFREF